MQKRVEFSWKRDLLSHLSEAQEGFRLPDFGGPAIFLLCSLDEVYGVYNLISTSTPEGRFKLMRESTVRSVGSTKSMRRL